MNTSELCDARQENISKIITSMISALQDPEKSPCFKYFVEGFNKFSTLTSDAIPGEQITLITQLMLILFEKVCNDPQSYETYFLKLVEYCWLPVKVVKVSDMLTYRDDIRIFFDGCAYILGSTQNLEIIRRLLQLLIIGARGRKHCRFKNKFFTDCFVSSKIPEIVSELLVITEFHLYCEYLSALEHILVSDLECQEFVKYNAVDIISRRLMCNWMQNEQFTDDDLKRLPLPTHLDLSRRILWLLLNAYLNSSPTFKNKIDLVVSHKAWISIRNVFVMLCYNRHKKQERNSFYLLFRIIWDLYAYEGHRQFITEIIKLSVLTENPCKDPNFWFSSVQFFPDTLDFELKICFMSYFCANRKFPLTTNIIRDCNLISSLMLILDITEKLMWTQAQREKLMYHALLGLLNMFPAITEDFLIYKGPKRLLQIIEQTLNSILPFNLLFLSLSCINKSLNIPDSDRRKMIKEYVGNDATSLLTKLLQAYLVSSKLPKLNQNILSVIFCILGKLKDETCKYYIEVTNICHALLIKYIKRKTNSEFLHPKLLLAIMTYLWECLMCTSSGFNCFITSGGIYTILDVIEQFPLAIKLVGLSMLCDFCEKDVALTCLLTWRAKDGSTVVPFLLKLYRKQTIFDDLGSNKKYRLKGVNYVSTNNFKNKGIAEDMTRSKQMLDLKSENAADSSVATLELLGSCKPKISVLLQILACSPHSNIANECYLISSTSLSYDDKITAIEAEHYFDLKYGEVWVEVEDYFRITEYTPFVFDKTLLGYQVKQYERLIGYIFLKQTKYQLQDKVKEIKSEHALYKELHDQLLSESLDALQELKKITMSSCKQVRMQEYNRMIKQLENMKVKYGFNIHKTFPKAIRVNIFSDKIGIHSDIVIDPNPKEPIRQISTDSFPCDMFEPIQVDNISSLHNCLNSQDYRTDSDDNIRRTADDY